MKRAVFAGTFDPFTVGHFDLVKRAAELFDEVIIAVAGDGTRKKCVCDKSIRADIVKKSVKKIKNVSVQVFDGLLTDFAKENGAEYLIRGIRNGVDFEYEKNLYAVYKSTDPNIEIFYLIAQPNYSFISSSFVKELLSLHGDISAYIVGDALSVVKELYK